MFKRQTTWLRLPNKDVGETDKEIEETGTDDISEEIPRGKYDCKTS